MGTIRLNNSIVTGLIQMQAAEVDSPPEGVLYADTGSFAFDSVNDVVWVKAAGDKDTNTGWQFVGGAPSAWTSVSTFGTGWSAGGWDERVRYRKIGPLVEVEACVACVGGGVDAGVFTLPAGFRPEAPHAVPAVKEGGTYTGIITVSVDTDGVVSAPTSTGAGNYFISLVFEAA